MLNRLILSVIVALIVAVGTVAVWNSLKQSNIDQIARVAEAESYAARSQLVRRVDSLLSAIKNAGVFWSAYGHLPADLWAADAGVELEHFDGLTVLLWDDPARGIRYARTVKNTSLNYRPADDEWTGYQALLERARHATQNAIAGPFRAPDGNAYFEVYFINGHGAQSGTVAAIVYSEEMLAGMLAEDSPGYAIQVFSDDVLLYERGEADIQAPSSWTREGQIRSSLGSLWRVIHSPTTELVASLRSPTVDLVLLLGLLIAGLVGTVTFENSRARSRALAAESAEKRLAELNRHLEQQVSERTADLQTLTDSVAHDLRNPLNAISVNAQLLEAQLAENPVAESANTLSRVGQSCKQMAEILDRLLGLSTVAHSTFEREHVDVRAMVEDVIADLLVAEPPPPIEFTVAELPAAEADRKLLKMLLINLLSNAMKYTRNAATRKITVDCEMTDSVHAYCIRDNGIGFDQESADRLFIAFDRLDGAKTAEGVGLGLTIAARVATRHGGTIWAKGEPGQGASFYFTLTGRLAP